MKSLITASLLAAAFIIPAIAQTSVPTPQAHTVAVTDAPAPHDAAGRGDYVPSERNSVMTDDGDMRVSKIVGSSVYDDQNKKIGIVDDLVIGQDHSIQAVLLVGGFLGVNAKLVKLPFGELQFGNAKESGANRIVLPGTTKKQLISMPNYHFTGHG